MPLEPFKPFHQPSELLADLIRRQDNPYPGLRPFRKDEDWLFFGRKRQVFDLLEVLTEAHFVSTIGPSGCGKSSLIRAGVLPALEKGAAPKAGSLWTSTTMRPGGSPFANLTDALIAATDPAQASATTPEQWAGINMALFQGRDGVAEFFAAQPLPGGRRLLLLIDQFEELFHRGNEADGETEEFVALLVGLFREPVESLYIITTMRTDYLGDCARYDGLAELVNDTFYLIPRLTQDELRDTIARPAEVVGGRIEPALVDELLRSAPRMARLDAEADHLPLMQHVLMWLWARARRTRDDDQPTSVGVDDYNEVGGLVHALSRHADTILDELKSAVDTKRSAQVERVTAAVFRQLVECHDYRFIRRPVTIAEIIQASRSDPSAEPLLDLDDLAPVIERFSADDCSFIDVRRRRDAPLTAGTELDIGHEALIRRWHTLEAWAGDETQAGRHFTELVKAAIANQHQRREALDRRELESYRDSWRQTQALYSGQSNTPRVGEDLYLVERLLLPLKPAWDWLLARLGPYCSRACRPLWKLLGSLRGRLVAVLPEGLSSTLSGSRHEVPNRFWAQRYLAPLTLPLEHREDDLYATARRFWERSRYRQRWRSLVYSILPLAAVVMVVAGIAYSRWAENKQVNEVNFQGFVQRASVLAKGRDNVDKLRLVLRARDQWQPHKPAWGGIGAWFDGWRERLSSDHADILALFSGFADLYSIEAEDWGTLVRGNPAVPFGNAVHLRGDALGHCVATIDAIGELALACRSDGDKTRTVHTVLAAAPLVTAADFSGPPPDDNGKADHLQLAVRIARVAVQHDAGRPPQLVAVTAVAAGGLRVWQCTPGDGDGTQLTLDCGDRVLDPAKVGSGDAKLRNSAIAPQGGYLAALYRDSGPTTADANPFSLVLYDLRGSQPASAVDFRLNTASDCRSPGDPQLMQLRITGGDANVSVVFDNNAYCQWRLSLDGPSTDGPVAPVERHFFQEAARLQLDLTDDGDKAVIGVGPHFLLWRRPCRDSGDSGRTGACAGPPDAGGQQTLPRRYLHTGNLLALRVLDAERIASSNDGAEVFLSFFDLDRPLQRLTSNDRNILTLSPGDADGSVYGIARCRPLPQSANHAGDAAGCDVLRWRPAADNSARFFIIEDPEQSVAGATVAGTRSPQALAQAIYRARHPGKDVPDISIVYRTGSTQQDSPLALSSRQLQALYQAISESAIVVGGGKDRSWRKDRDKIESELWRKLSSVYPLTPDGRQLIAIDQRGNALFIFREADGDQATRLFALVPSRDMNLHRRLDFEGSTLSCEHRAEGQEAVLGGCWLALRFKDYRATVVYHFPQVGDVPAP